MDLNVFCDICAKRFDAKYKLDDHVKNAHDEGEYPCDDCSKTFIGKRKLLNHKDSHKIVECTKCNQWFIYPTNNSYLNTYRVNIYWFYVLKNNWVWSS